MGRFRSRGNRIVSDDGFAVESIHYRGGLNYLEGGRTMRVDSEFLADKAVLVFADSIRSWTTSEGTSPVSPADVQRIVQNIVAAFAFIGYSTEVDWAPHGSR